LKVIIEMLRCLKLRQSWSSRCRWQKSK
jgi:hypothetical protein